MSERLRPPINWLGGKGALLRRLLPLIPRHRIYCEVFGGAAALLFAKTPSPVEVYNDLDSRLVNLFRVLRNKTTFERFHRLVSLTPYSREEFYFSRDHMSESDDLVERAYRFFVVARMSFASHLGSGWGYAVHASESKMAATTSAYLSAIDRLPQIHNRIMRVQIEHDDFRNILERYDSPETFFYLDPPYVPETRRSGGYVCGMTTEEHATLVEMLLKIKGKALLSGYRNSVYQTLEKNGWKSVDFSAVCRAAGRTRVTGYLGPGALRTHQPRTETVWMNYDTLPLFGPQWEDDDNATTCQTPR